MPLLHNHAPKILLIVIKYSLCFNVNNSQASVKAKDCNMSVQPQNDQVQAANSGQPSDKELNFRRQEQMFQQKLEQERLARQQAEERLAALERQSKASSNDDDDSEPYVDHKKLDKKLTSFEQRIEQKIDQRAEAKAQSLLQQERQDTYMKDNPDFNNVMSNETVQRFAETHPRLAKSILSMPEGFERQKLVYENIKSLGIDKPKAKEPSVQDKIDANRRSPYYQPSGVANAPYSAQGDFSQAGQKNAYEKMQELKARLRI